jgi:hypothetical protein
VDGQFLADAFSFDLTGTGMAINVCLLVATLIKNYRFRLVLGSEFCQR